MSMKIDLPRELEPLRGKKQWVLWKYEERNGKRTKPPFDPVTGRYAKSTDPTTWGTFDQVKKVLDRDSRYQGIGVMLTDGLFGVDLDHCIDFAGDIGEAAARAVYETANSYTEYSPSGNGVHILMLGATDAGGNKYHIADPLEDSGEDVEGEIYENGRYFTVTGNVYGEPRPLAERTAQGKAIRALLEQAAAALKLKRNPPPAQQVQQAQEVPPRRVPSGAKLTDEEVLTKARNSAKGATFSSLWDGDISAFGGDHSRADQALCNTLAFWTGNDAEQIDRLFRQSGLYRQKWEREDYRAATIGKAVASSNVYDPEEYRRQQALRDFQPIEEDGGTEAPDQEAAPLSGPEIIDLFLQRVQSRKFEPVPTGVTDLDNALGGGFFRQQLVLLGAAPGLGKTALAQWIFEDMARRGVSTIYLNLEMSQDQMLARSLARFSARRGTPLPPVAILKGYSWTEEQRKAVLAAAEEYKNDVAPRLIYNPSGVTAQLDSILKYLKAEGDRAKEEGRPVPLVVVDYLQIIRGNDREEEVAVIKRAVAQLKDFAIKYETMVFMIVAHNRKSNSSGAVTMESGRDTSALEYSADVQLAMTYTALLYQKPEGDQEKADSPQQQKKRKKRKTSGDLAQEERNRISVVVTKGRWGGQGTPINFIFDGASMTYRPVCVEDFDLIPPEEDPEDDLEDIPEEYRDGFAGTTVSV